MDVIVLGRDRGTWVMCMLIGMYSKIRLPRSEKKGCMAKFRSINKVNIRAISGDAVAGANPYTVDEHNGM